MNRDNIMHIDAAPEQDRRVKEKLVTAADLRAEDAALERRAQRKGIKLDTSTVNHEALAREINEADKRRVPGWSPPPAPKGWIQRQVDEGLGASYVEPNRRLVAILSCTIENDGRAWMHFSVSHRERIPSWGELRVAKELFLGDREAYQVLPPKARYVSIHPHVLNLYALLDGVALPDFTRGTGGI